MKACEVLLVSKDEAQVLNWLEQIKDAFIDVRNSEIRNVIFNDDHSDYRTNVYFFTDASKNKTYEIMNKIKANPIKFYS